MYSCLSVLEVDQHNERSPSVPRLSNLSPGSSQDRAEDEKESNPTTPLLEVSPSWNMFSPLPTCALTSSQTCHCASQALRRRDDQDSYSTHTVSVRGHNLGKLRAPALTRKVLRRKGDGQVQVYDESFPSRQMKTGDKDRMVSPRELCPEAAGGHSKNCNKSFICPERDSLLNQYRQPSDPVGRYQAYKQSWNNLQGALEQGKREVRDEIREKMMSAPFQPVLQPPPTPNSYVTPTEKKRYGLRWAVRQDLANGNMPCARYCYRCVHDLV